MTMGGNRYLGAKFAVAGRMGIEDNTSPDSMTRMLVALIRFQFPVSLCTGGRVIFAAIHNSTIQAAVAAPANHGSGKPCPYGFSMYST